MKVATRRLLKEQIAAVVVPRGGEKNDAMWHVPQFLISGIIFVALLCIFSILSMSRLKCADQNYTACVDYSRDRAA